MAPQTQARPAKQSAVVSQAQLKKQRGTIERVTALIVLFVSFAGTIAALSGGWPALLASPQLTPIIGGIAFQAVLTYLEWHYFDNVPIAWGARLFDTAFTAWGFGPLFVTGLTALLASWGVPQPEYAAWGVIGVVSFLTAWYPESRLVD